jgi:hypothetical protein
MWRTIHRFQEVLVMRAHSVRDRLHTGLAVLGATALIVAGVGAVSQAANGDPFKLGSKNKATKSTSLTNKKATPALKLKVKSGPALSVNTPDLIANLNADSVDSKGIDELEPTTQTFSLGTVGMAGSATPFAFQTTTLPSGNYEFNIHGLLSQGAGDNSECAVLDATRLIASGGTDTTSIFALSDADDTSGNNLDSHGVGPVVAGNRLMFICFIDTTTTLVVPTQFTVKRLDRVGAIPGVGPTTFPKGAGKLG